MSIQQHPEYHEGFYDAADGEPLFENDCSPEYKEGWLAYYECRSFFDRTYEDIPKEFSVRFPVRVAQ